MTLVAMVIGVSGPGSAVAAGGEEAASAVITVVADPVLTADLDQVVAESPAATCLTVRIDGQPVYVHDGAEPMVPASTLKLLTASAALEELGPDHRFVTRAVTDATPVKGLLDGDLVLVGGGDPLLTTDLNRFVRHIGDDLYPTSLEKLADEVAASGVRLISGRVLGDDARYDTARTVASWPDRYVTQNQSGPLSALTVDDGYDISLEGEVTRRRSDDPARSAAVSFTRLLTDRGILIGGDAGTGPAPSGAFEVATVASAPLTDVISELLVTSDNQTAELLTKELGFAASGSGSTDAGLAVIEQHLVDRGSAGADLADGSGLDPTNQVTCDELVEVLDLTGGIEGSLGRALPVAGKTGTLRNRFTDTPASGLLRAKTGYLAEVTSLAGFVPLASGEVATFAYIANGQIVDNAVKAPQDRLATILATYELACPEGGTPPLVAPVAAYVGPVGALNMVPLPSVLLPIGVASSQVFQDRYPTLVDRCLAEDEAFGVVLVAADTEGGGA